MFRKQKRPVLLVLAVLSCTIACSPESLHSKNMGLVPASDQKPRGQIVATINFPKELVSAYHEKFATKALSPVKRLRVLLEDTNGQQQEKTAYPTQEKVTVQFEQVFEGEYTLFAEAYGLDTSGNETLVGTNITPSQRGQKVFVQAYNTATPTLQMSILKAETLTPVGMTGVPPITSGSSNVACNEITVSAAPDPMLCAYTERNENNEALLRFLGGGYTKSGGVSYKIFYDGSLIEDTTGLLNPNGLFSKVVVLNGRSPDRFKIHVTDQAKFVTKEITTTSLQLPGSNSQQTPPPTPGHPTGNASGTPFNYSLALSWLASPGATFYKLYRNSQYLTQVSAAQHTDTNLSNASNSYYVFACNSVGCSLASGEHSISGPVASPPQLNISPTSGTTATNFDVSASGCAPNSSVTVNIEQNGTVLSARYPQSDSNGNVHMSLSGNDYPFFNTGTFSVRVNNGQTSNYSNAVQMTVTPPGPNPPSSLISSNVTSSGYTLSWAAVPGATRYVVYQDDIVVANALTTNTITYGGRAAGRSYRLEVAAANNMGESARSSPLWITTLPAETVPSVPNSLASSNVTSSGYTLSWAAVPGATRYVVYQDDIVVANALTTNTITYGGRAAGRSYRLEVAAANNAVNVKVVVA